MLREKYFQADVGITGGNYLVAETGSSVIVTNEGNGDLTQTLARVHVVTSGIERIVPSLDDVSLFQRLLARSGTGQETETYTTFSTGPRRPGDPDGPDEYHVVLVDNGRSKMLGGKFQDMLRCIRCGACMNHCPVYGAVGGTPTAGSIRGRWARCSRRSSSASTAPTTCPTCHLNGRCQSVCPVRIPLPELLRELRHRQSQAGLRPPPRPAPSGLALRRRTADPLRAANRLAARA